MDKDKETIANDSSQTEQLKRYADDLAKVYNSEKQKRKELQDAHEQLVKYADDLKNSVQELKSTNKQLEEAYMDTIHRLVLASEFKDEDTGDHIIRMSRYSALVAEKLGLPDKEIKDILCAASMHDVGKIGIPDNILMKPGKLTDEEFAIMKTHASIGANILANAKAEIIQVAQKIAVSHHEKWNGKGYPSGHTGCDIPIAGRIVSIADTFDALTSKRPYKDPYPIEVALDIIRKEHEQQFDPDIVDVFLANIEGILKIKKEVGLAEDVSLSDFSWSERDQETREI
ncbi:MAG: HD-GYP domain-containing protein [Candidatus Anammoxibacter sp.]